MSWNVSMKDEKDGTKLFSEGKQNAKITGIEFVEKSNNGNPYFKWELTMENGEGKLPVITTLLKGKRWLLKQMLSACNIEAKSDDPDKKYSFEEKDVLTKIVTINIKNKKSSFTGRDGNLINIEKSEVIGIEKYKNNGNNNNAQDEPF